MKAITFAVLCVAVISADPASVSSYSSSPSNVRDFEYSGGSYPAGKHSYGDLSGAAAYIAGGSPYAKSDTRYSSDGSGDSNDPRASLTSSFYKTKYGSEAVVNAIRPSPFHTSSSTGSSSSGSSPSSSSSSSSEVSSSQGGSHYSTGDSPSGAYSTSSGSSPYYETSSGGSGSSSPSEYTASASYSTAYGDRSPAYSTTGDAGSSGGHGEYVAAGRPGGLVYGGYSSGSGLSEYQQARPSYGHSVGSPVSSSLPSGDYMHLSSAVHGHPPHPHHHHHHHHHPMSEEYSPHIQPQPSHGYKTYVTSPSSYPSKSYSSVFGALKSLFGGGMLSDPAPSATHVSAYPSAPSGPGPMYSSSMMHAAHHGPSAPSMGPAGPGYYFSTGGPGSSGSPYSKSYAPMRLVSGYGGSGSSGGKIIVVRDSSGGHGSPYTSGAAGILGSPSGYVAKSKISAFSPSPLAPSYLSASPSSLSYSASAPPSGAYPGSYSSSGSFPGHGGSTFLGYSA